LSASFFPSCRSPLNLLPFLSFSFLPRMFSLSFCLSSFILPVFLFLSLLFCLPLFFPSCLLPYFPVIFYTFLFEISVSLPSSPSSLQPYLSSVSLHSFLYSSGVMTLI
jgi:hypothetical protein